MPANKLAALRYRIIDRLLVEKRFVTRDEMRDACAEALDLHKVGERTIDQDIADMRYDNQLGFMAPIRFDKARRAYHYEDPNYSIDRTPLNRDELKSLAFVASLLDQFKTVDIFETYQGAVEKIVNAVNIRRMQEGLPRFDFIDFEKSPTESGTRFLSPLIGSITRKNVVLVEYRRFDSSHSLTHVIHPYFLKEYRNRWYLLGWHEKAQDICTLALDRMIDVRLQPDRKYRHSDFDPAAYFRHSVGIISRMGKPVTVKLRFTHHQGNYLLTQPIHPSQEVIRETKNHIWIRMHVAVTWELISTILGWGKEVAVISPASLRSQVKLILEQALEGYSKP